MIYFVLKSYNVKLLDSFCNNFLAINLPVFNFFKLSGPVFLPKKSKNFTVIRSPHVNSLSRERFTFQVHRRVFVFKTSYDFSVLDSRENFIFHLAHYILDTEETNIKDFINLRKFLIKNLPAGISLQLKVK